MAQRFYEKAGVQAAIGGGIFLLIATIITICHQRSELVQDNKRLKGENANLKEKNQNLERDFLPFKTVAIQWFGGDGPTNLLKLADRITEMHSELEQKTAEINKLKSSVEELKPSLQLLKYRQSKDGDLWVTRLYFGSKDGRGFPRFSVALAFEKPYETAKAFASPSGNDAVRTGAGGRVSSNLGSISVGELRFITGESKSQACKIYGTQLPDDGNLVLEFRSKEQIQQIVSLNLEPSSH
jgi:cell division protein FtsB